MESLQRRTTETIFLSSKLARSWLRLETSQISITSKDKRFVPLSIYIYMYNIVINKMNDNIVVACVNSQQTV